VRLKDEIVKARRAGQDHKALLALVHGHQAPGMAPRDSYDVLEEIWQELGLADTEKGGPLRDELEFVRERVWFQGSASRRTESQRGGRGVA
jgi:hypothetical protein